MFSAVVEDLPLPLPEKRTSQPMRHFISRCLQRNPQKLPTAADLLLDPYLFDACSVPEVRLVIGLLAKIAKAHG